MLVDCRAERRDGEKNSPRRRCRLTRLFGCAVRLRCTCCDGGKIIQWICSGPRLLWIINRRKAKGLSSCQQKDQRRPGAHAFLIYIYHDLRVQLLSRPSFVRQYFHRTNRQSMQIMNKNLCPTLQTLRTWWTQLMISSTSRRMKRAHLPGWKIRWCPPWAPPKRRVTAVVVGLSVGPYFSFFTRRYLSRFFPFNMPTSWFGSLLTQAVLDYSNLRNVLMHGPVDFISAALHGLLPCRVFLIKILITSLLFESNVGLSQTVVWSHSKSAECFSRGGWNPAAVTDLSARPLVPQSQPKDSNGRSSSATLGCSSGTLFDFGENTRLQAFEGEKIHCLPSGNDAVPFPFGGQSEHFAGRCHLLAAESHYFPLD